MKFAFQFFILVLLQQTISAAVHAESAIINGIETTEYPGVGALLIDFNTPYFRLCTISKAGLRTYSVSAHCLYSCDPSTRTLKLTDLSRLTIATNDPAHPNEPLFMKSPQGHFANFQKAAKTLAVEKALVLPAFHQLSVNKSCEQEKDSEMSKYDAAFLLANDPTDKGEHAMPFGLFETDANPEVVIVGFGMNASAATSAGLKRAGMNTISKRENGVIETMGSPKDKQPFRLFGIGPLVNPVGKSVSINMGDSGGPMILNGAVIGTASHYQKGHLFGLKTKSIFFDWNSPQGHELIRQARAQAFSVLTK